jgi:hypothetical protein
MVVRGEFLVNLICKSFNLITGNTTYKVNTGLHPLNTSRNLGLRVGNYSYNQMAVVTSDSGSPLLHMPRKVVDGIVRELDAKKEGTYLVIKCSRKFEIQLKINGQIYALPAEQLTYDIGGDKCLLNIQAADSDLWLLVSFCKERLMKR